MIRLKGGEQSELDGLIAVLEYEPARQQTDRLLGMAAGAELQEVPESDQEEENSVKPEVSYTEDYDQPVEEEAEVTSYETQPVEPVQEEATYEEPVQEEIVQEEVGDINPHTGREYESNSVRMHPKRIGYVQVYDRANHKWTDMTEWAFLGYQERKKVLLGEDYEPPIYLD